MVDWTIAMHWMPPSWIVHDEESIDEASMLKLAWLLAVNACEVRPGGDGCEDKKVVWWWWLCWCHSEDAVVMIRLAQLAISNRQSTKRYVQGRM